MRGGQVSPLTLFTTPSHTGTIHTVAHELDALKQALRDVWCHDIDDTTASALLQLYGDATTVLEQLRHKSFNTLIAEVDTTG